MIPNLGGCAIWVGRGRGITCGYTYGKRANGEQNNKRPPALDPRPVRVCRVQHSLNVNGVFKHIRGRVRDQAGEAVTNVIWLATSSWMDWVELRLHRMKDNYDFSIVCALRRGLVESLGCDLPASGMKKKASRRRSFRKRFLMATRHLFLGDERATTLSLPTSRSPVRWLEKHREKGRAPRSSYLAERICESQRGRRR